MQSSLVIPAHNEERRLPATLTTYGEALRRRYAGGFEIVVIANGSDDDTVGAAKMAAVREPQIRVVEIAEKVGKGGAVLEGFRRANGDRVVFADADGATAAHSLLELMDLLDHHDVVICSRRLEESVIPQKQSVVRRAFGSAFSVSADLLFDLPFNDTQCGTKAFRRPAARKLSRVVSETRWTFDIDLLLSARRLGLDVYECPVEWSDQAGTQLRYGSTTLEVLPALWKMKSRQNKPLPQLPERPILGKEHERKPPRTIEKETG